MPNDQPPIWKAGEVALWCEPLASRGQGFSIVLVMEHMVGESTLDLVDARALSMNDGVSTFTVDVRDLHVLEIPAALVLRLLSNTGASLS